MEAKIIDFSVYNSCILCRYLCNLGNGRFTCNYLSDVDGNDFYPIEDFKPTEDYGLCDGEYFELEVNKYERNQRRKVIKRGNFIKCSGEGS